MDRFTRWTSLIALGLSAQAVCCGLLSDYDGIANGSAVGGSAGDSSVPDAGGSGGSAGSIQTGGVGATEGGAKCDAATETNRAFPTAEGFGAISKGGRGGRVVRVTNHDDAGAGSLRDALKQSGARFIVFDISGVIELSSDITITGQSSFVYVAGQTSPLGVQLKGGGLVFGDGFKDGIVRHLRVRPGGPDSHYGIRMVSSQLGAANIVVDHCDIMWTTATALELNEVVSNITLQWSA